MRLSSYMTGLGAAFTALTAATAVSAQDGLDIVGAPHQGGMGFQYAATEVARELQGLDHMLVVIITTITLFVTLLLAVVIVRFNKRANPKPATFTHNSPLEIAWTIVPIVILVFIGAFSLPVLFKQMEIPKADITLKVTGNQWYWSYEYPDEGFGFDSFMIGDGKVLTPEVEAELVAAGYTRDEFLLATDTAVVIPVNKTVVVQTTGADVIHAWFVPAFGIQLSSVPGRLSELWFNAEKEGVYFGQCNTLCGKDHAYMPITVKVVSEEAYAEWLVKAKEEYAGIPATVKVASAD
jgi:cytochrome c oxidase subunit II